MIVLYDTQIFGMQDYGGISRYFYEIIKRISKDDVIHPFFVHNNAYTKDGLKDKILNKFKYRNYLYTALNIIIGIPKIIFGKYDIFHPTYYEDYFLPFTKNKKIIITVYDFVHEKMSSNYSNLSNTFINKKKNVIKRADHIIAISENTKKDLMNLYGIDKDKISVIYLGNSLKKWDGKKRCSLPSKYILFVGQRWMYKNFENFIKAMSIVVKEHPEFVIVSAGGGKLTDDEKESIKKAGLKGKVIHATFKNDNELAEIYSRSSLFVYPSLYEGFGIPILEAFSCRTPIAISNTSCFPEIAKNAAQYFDPKDPKSISKSVINVLSNNKLKENMVKLGTARLLSFSWEKTAKQTLDVYKKVLEK